VTTTNLDHLAALIASYEQTQAEADKWQKAADVLKARIQAEMGEATEATLAGKPVFTWRNTGQFNAKRFSQDHPDLTTKYTKPVTRDELDVEALKVEQPDLFTAYRSRRFLKA